MLARVNTITYGCVADLKKTPSWETSLLRILNKGTTFLCIMIYIEAENLVS